MLLVAVFGLSHVPASPCSPPLSQLPCHIPSPYWVDTFVHDENYDTNDEPMSNDHHNGCGFTDTSPLEAQHMYTLPVPKCFLREFVFELRKTAPCEIRRLSATASGTESIHRQFVGTGVRVSIAYPPDTDTPGYEVEMKTKVQSLALCILYILRMQCVYNPFAHS